MPSVDPGTTSTLVTAAAAQLGPGLAGLGRGALVAGSLSPWLGALLAAAGVAALLVGARWRRPVAGVGGAAVGALLGLALHPFVLSRVGSVDLGTAVVLGAALVGGAGVLLPPLFPFAAGALPGALLARHVPVAGSGAFGAAIGALVGGTVALVFAETVAALVASSLGAVLLGGGLLSLLRGRVAVAELAGRPFLLLAWIVLLAIAGTAFQRGRSWRAGGAPPPREGPPKLELR